MSLSRRQQGELTLVVVLAMLVAAAAVAAGRFDLVSAKRSDVRYDKVYTQTQARVTPDERIDGDWGMAPKGLSLRPGQSGAVTIRVQGDRDGRLVVFLFGQGGPEWRATLAVSGDGVRFREVVQEAALNGARVDLTRAAGHLDQVWLRITASVESVEPSREMAAQPVLLSRVRIVTLNDPLIIPNLPLASLLVLTPVLAYLGRLALGRTGALSYSLLILCGLAVLAEAIAGTVAEGDPARWWERVVVSQQRDGYFLAPYVLLLVIVGWQAQVWKPGGPQARLWTGFALGGILAWGASNRLAAFQEVGWSQLGPDALTYMQLADSLRSPYDTMYREPLWIWMIKGWFWLVGHSAAHQRLLSAVLSLAVIWAAAKLFQDYTGRPLVGVLAAALLAGNPYLISLSTRGLREEAYMLAVLGIAYPVLVRTCRLSAPAQAAGLALAGAAAHLLRFNSYLFFLPLLAFWAWRQRPGRWRLALLPLAFIAALSGPHLVHNARQFGDPLYSVNVHFVWSRNYEFVILKQTGCAGCPSREEVEADSTAGPALGAREYLFGLHSPGEVVERTLQGYRDMYLRPTALFEMQSGTVSGLGYALYLVGLLFVLAGAHREILAVVLLLANGVPFAMTLDIDPRIAIHTAPFVAFVLAYGIARSLEAVMNLREYVRTPRALVLAVPGVARR